MGAYVHAAFQFAGGGELPRTKPNLSRHHLPITVGSRLVRLANAMDHTQKEHLFTQAFKKVQITDWLDRGGDVNVTSFSKHGHTMLMMACIKDHADITAELVRRGADLNMKSGGKTALHHCAALGHPACARLLLEAGAKTDIRVDVDDSEFTENDGLTALEIVQNEIAEGGMRPRHRDMLLVLQQHGASARPAPSNGGAVGRR